jgi:aryl-alcohol dehydrogenase
VPAKPDRRRIAIGKDHIMKITAAVVHERSGPFSIEQLDLCDPRADELLIEVVASGMCATDLHGRDAYYSTKFPKVFGHEGAGVVRAVGSAVTKIGRASCRERVLTSV